MNTTLWQMIRANTECRIELAVLKHANRTEITQDNRRVAELEVLIDQQEERILMALKSYEAFVNQIGATAQRAESHHARY